MAAGKSIDDILADAKIMAQKRMGQSSAETATLPENDATQSETGATLPESAATLPEIPPRYPDEQSEFKPGDEIMGTYLVVSEPIRGGMGAVWRVRHRGWNTFLCMKRPQPGLFSSEEQKAAFARECEAWIGLGLHPNIVSCYYVREINDVPTVFAEWMENDSLESHIRDCSVYAGTAKQQQKRLLDIAIQFARGLCYAHEQGLIHKDVKPANLLLTDDWQAKVGDFGLAGARSLLTAQEGEATVLDEDGMTMLAASGGYTLPYCSPEQLNAQLLTRHTDIFSWAVSVLELYLGERLWNSGIAAAAGCRDYFHLCRVTVPAELQELLAGCMEEREEDRPHDFSEILVRLTEIYNTEFDETYPRSEPRTAAETADSLNNRALSYLDLGKEDEASEFFDRAQELDHNNMNVLCNRLLFLWRSGKITDTQALEGLRAARQTAEISGTKMAEYELVMAEAYLEGGQGDLALSVLEPLEKQLGGKAEYIECMDSALSLVTEERETIRRDRHLNDDRHELLSEDGSLILRRNGEYLVLENSRLPPKKRKMTLDIKSDYARECRFSRDGKLVAILNGANNSVTVVDTATGKPRKKEACKYSMTAAGLHFSGSEKYLASFSLNKNAVFLDVAKGFTAAVKLELEEVPCCVAISRDGRNCLAGYNGGKIKLYDAVSGAVLRDYQCGSSAIIWAELSPDGKLMVCCEKEGTAHIIRLSSGQCLMSVENWKEKSKRKIFEANFSPDGKKLSCLCAVPYEENYARELTRSLPPFLYRAPLQLSRIRTFQVQLEQTGEFERCLAKAEEALKERNYRELEAQLEKARGLPGMQHDTRLCALNEELCGHAVPSGIRAVWVRDRFGIGKKTPKPYDAAADGLFLVDTNDGDHTKLVDLRRKREEVTINFPGKNLVWNMSIAMTLSHDGKTAAGSRMMDKEVRLFDTETGRIKKALFVGDADWHPESLAFSPDDSLLATSVDRGFVLWDVKSGRQVLKGKWGEHVKMLCFTPDGQSILLVDYQATRSSVALFDVRSGELLIDYGPNFLGKAVAVSPDGKSFLAGAGGGRAVVCALRDGRIKAELEMDTESWNELNYVRFLQDGRFVLLQNESLSVWDTETGSCVYRFESTGEDEVNSAVLCPDGRNLLIAEKSGVVANWYIDYEYRVN